MTAFRLLLVSLVCVWAIDKEFDRPVVSLTGTARVDVNSPHVFKEGTFFCDKYTNQCLCAEQSCQVINRGVRVENITVVTMKYSSMDRVPAYSFRGMKKLETLEIVQGSLVTITPNAFVSLPELKVLNLAVNMISSLHPLSFNGLRKLKQLILMKNEVKQVGLILRATLPGILPSLSHLHIAGNSFVRLEESSFDSMINSSITTLEIFMCDLDFIHPRALLPFAKLDELYLGGNDKLSEDNLVDVFEALRPFPLSVVDISSMSFSNVPFAVLESLGRTNVSTLLMTRTSTPILGDGDFPYMPRLKTLYLTGNRVHSVERNAFQKLPNLKRLFVQQNIMTVYPLGLQLPSLEELNLSGYPKVPIRFELNRSFVEMRSLRVLNLSFKMLLRLRTDSFQGLMSLEVLDIRKCGVNSLDEGVFLPLKSLRSLDISENQLVHFQNGRSPPPLNLFNGLTTVRQFVFQMAQASDVDPRIWRGIRNVETLDLSRNSFTRLGPILMYLKSIRGLYMHGNNVEMWNATILKDARNETLESLDLSKNFLRVVGPPMIEDFRRLRFLNLTRNPFRCDCQQLQFLSWLNSTNVTIYHHDYPYNTGRLESYSCHEPSEYLAFSLRAAARNLTVECKNAALRRTSGQREHVTAFLVTVSLLLALLLLALISFYVFRKQIITKMVLKAGTSLALSPVEKTFSFDAFVSYSNYDSEWVFTVFLPALESSTKHVKLCVYDRDFVAGKAITDCIVDSIKKSRKTILIVSQHFLLSSWCRFETNLARSVLLDENRDGLVVIKLGEVNLSKADSNIRFLLQSRLYLTWSNEPARTHQFWRKLDKALEKPQDQKDRKSFFSSFNQVNK